MRKAKAKPKKQKQKRGYGRGRTVVVSVRFDPQAYADLKAEADARGVNISEVVHRRLSIYETFRDAPADYDRGWMSAENMAVQRDLRTPVSAAEFEAERDEEWQQHMREDTEKDLVDLGYTRIEGPGGALWAEPGASIPASIVKAIQERKP
ncbi:hypothetical protein M2189_004843 [Bradyrhizobium japonicum]|uniref:hypothetical protein n=1 Tax=Bradyrhizobium japonicum TaxID=375 RepID=UPI00216742F4|nr:hypothetical protein [Bradyrhizobium japonicum]MCS3496197.1 hypothetical protein [Bradyrhizobium japonicum]MCS3961640.1 hypothetical protein [Bradyrhizobium japonicum]MCS3993956.1 hypothetical protein [Bradyrhizobium japonicum]